MRLLNVEAVAKVCHEANCAYSAGLGDSSHKSWEDSPEWQKDSAVMGVRQMLKYPGTTAEEMHESWTKQKVEDGWIYGPVKDPRLKQHPCMVPYNELPEEQRFKDALFSAVVNALYGAVVV